MSSDLEFRTYDATPGLAAEGPVRAWVQAMARGFHQGRFDDALVERVLRHAQADRAVLRGAWSTASRLDDELPVATYLSWDRDLNVGGGRRLPLHMITDITVSPTHRRRGLLRRLMDDDLGAAASRGLPLAALTVSEGSIYGRFGFGPATRTEQLQVDVTARFALRPEVAVADGELVLLAPGETAGAVVEEVFDRFHAATRGSADRPAYYRDLAHEAFDHESRTADGKQHTCVLVDGGRARGFVSYRHEGWPGPGERSTVTVRDLLADSPAVELRLWRFLADLDLVERVVWPGAPVDHPLAWAATDPRVVTVTGVRDRLWLRVLDVVTALEARPWGSDGELVLEVDDDQGHAAGRFRVRVTDGRAEVRRTTDVAQVRLRADTLASAYLGDVTAGTLAAAGRLHGDDAALVTFAGLFDVGPRPYSATRY